MQKSVLIALTVAVFSGLAVGVQSSLNSAAGKITGATLTGLLVNIAAGTFAGLVLIVIYFRQDGFSFSALQMPTLGIIMVAGILGIGVITGIAFSLPKIGIAAGLSAIIAGQMVMGIVIDTFGLTGGESIPLNWMRIGGVGLLALGAWAILPRG